jgi:hypothetical protein
VRWYKLAPFWWSGVLGLSFLRGAALEAVHGGLARIAIPRSCLSALGTHKGDGSSVDGADVRADNERLGGHGLRGGVSFNNIHHGVLDQSQLRRNRCYTAMPRRSLV